MITKVKGFNDILDEQSTLFQMIEEKSRLVLRLHGFKEIRTPILEKTELFQRSIGDTTDIVEKEMYTFSDRNGESMTMRPEGTAPVVRSYIENGMHKRGGIVKLYYMGQMFRYERPQKGRYRQFHQIGAEAFGSKNPSLDAEIIKIAVAILKELNIESYELNINSLGCKECRPSFRNKLLYFLSDRKDMLCEDCQRRIESNPLRTLDCKSEICIETTKNAPSVLNSLCAECSNHFEEVKRILKHLEIPFTINPKMVRGLDYYTGTTFEITTNLLGSQGTILAGGRYDRLVEELGGHKTPAIGFAMGVERLSLLLSHLEIKDKPAVFLAHMGQKAKDMCQKIKMELFSNGIYAEMDFDDKKLKNQLESADKMGALIAVIIGENEIEKGIATAKNMKTKEQFEIHLSDAAKTLVLHVSP